MDWFRKHTDKINLGHEGTIKVLREKEQKLRGGDIKTLAEVSLPQIRL